MVALLKKILSKVPSPLRLGVLAILVSVVLAHIADAASSVQQKVDPQNVGEEMLSMLSRHKSLSSALVVLVLVVITESIAKAL